MANYGVKGSVLKVTLSSASTTLTAVGQIRSIDAPGMTMNTREVTHLTSATKEYEATIGDPQEFKLSLLYDASDAGAVRLQALTTTPSTVLGGETFAIVYPTTTKFFLFQGVVTEFSPKGGDVEGTWMADVGIRPTRAITYPTT
jgi:hypothetical protein